MISKICNKCGIEKSLEEFHKHPQTKDGRLGLCKKCQNKASKKWREKNPERNASTKRKCYVNKRKEYNEKKNNWRRTNRDKTRKHFEKYAEKYPEKVLAHQKTMIETRAGRLVRPDNCESCFKECKPEGHHEDYSRPFDVDWLCKKCHIEADRKVLV